MQQNNWIITISGDLGSGKGTICEIIKSKYNFITYSTGDIQRKIAARYNMTTLELNKYAETHPEIDKENDSYFTEMSQSNENMVIDSRMAWHFIPNSFKVYIKVDVDVAAERIIHASRGSVESYSSFEEAKSKIIERENSENKRYMETYNVDRMDMGNYDLVIDSTNLSPDYIADFIIENAKKYFEK